MPVIGPIIEAILPGGPEGTAIQTPVPGADFAIDGMFFRIASTDSHPYQRQTAQFRKDQLDTSDKDGDQSLVGYWTRGQFSFHQGEGIKYYEASEADTEYRYNFGSLVDVHVPGQVTPQRSVTRTTLASVNWAGYSEAESTYVAVNDGKLSCEAGDYSPSPDTVTHACVHGGFAYVTTAGKHVVKVDLSDATGTDLYTSAVDLTGIWYAKDRLFVVDEGGSWYQLTPNPTSPPVAIGSDDLAFTVPVTGDGWQLVDTPASVVMAQGEALYQIALDSTGGFPTLAGPIQIAAIPPGEKVLDLAYGAGFLVIRSTLGVRVAQMTTSDSTFAYGPLLIEGDDTFAGPGTVAVAGDLAYVAHSVDGGRHVYSIDLSRTIGNNLQFPVSRQWDADGVFSAGGKPGPWTSTSVAELGDGYESGYLVTGFQRFGTLERKKFQSVTVTADGAGGTVAVSRVNSDGSTLSLYTMALASQNSVTITLRMDEPVEMVGLRFDLAPDSSDDTLAPTLLGYQIKALPAPKRQRLIRVPLLTFDREQRGTTMADGYEGWAWDRLHALENMEESEGTVRFIDYRTNEAGECYIEGVEHVGTTPPSSKSSGFGGYTMVTLRKL